MGRKHLAQRWHAAGPGQMPLPSLLGASLSREGVPLAERERGQQGALHYLHQEHESAECGEHSRIQFLRLLGGNLREGKGQARGFPREGALSKGALGHGAWGAGGGGDICGARFRLQDPQLPVPGEATSD